MQAIILAAGMGKRLKQLTQNNTKCMVKVNGVPLINRTLNQLEQHNLSRIVIVTGYEGQNFENILKVCISKHRLSLLTTRSMTAPTIFTPFPGKRLFIKRRHSSFRV